MTSKKAYSIVTIACFVSILFIPIGIVLMFFYTGWKKKIKIPVAAVLTILYILLAFLAINLQPSNNVPDITIPISVGIENSQSLVSSNKKTETDLDIPETTEDSKSKNQEQNSNDQIKKLPKAVTRQNNFFQSRAFYTLLFILFMLMLIIYQNLKGSKKKNAYENPYVDTEKYKLPLTAETKFPTVHFLKLKVNPGEKILYASETTKKEEEGDFVVTNKRVVVLSNSGDYEFPLPSLTAVSSVSNSVMLLTCGERKYYIFFPDGQLKYALAIVRWAYSNQ